MLAPDEGGRGVFVGSERGRGTWAAARAAGLDLGPWPDMAMGTVAATRGVFALASALVLPTALADGSPLPSRDLGVASALGAAAASLALQGSLIALALARLPLSPDRREERERALAHREMARAGIDALDATGSRDPSVDAFRIELASVLERASDDRLAPAADVGPRLEALTAQRARLRALRHVDRIPGKTPAEIEALIDQHEVYLRGG